MLSLNQRMFFNFFVALLFLTGSSQNGISAEDQPAFDAIAKNIQQAVKALEYPDEVGQDFVKMVNDWKCVEWKQKLSQAKKDLEEKKITADQAAVIEEEVAKELFEKIGKEIATDDASDKYFDLAKVLTERRANGPGFFQLFSVVGSAVGMAIEIVYALEPAADLESDRRHLDCGVDLRNGKMVVFDFACNSRSKPFMLKEEFTEDGNYWEVKEKGLLGIHNRIQVWDQKGILALIYNFHGWGLYDENKGPEALTAFTKAIELNPKYMQAYLNRAFQYSKQKKFAEALSDCDKAIEVDPKCADAYCKRGLVNFHAEKITEALLDLEKAIKVNPKSAKGYACRAFIYVSREKYSEAITASEKAIEVDPKCAEGYCYRGFSHLHLGRKAEAMADFDKAIDIDPKSADAFLGRGGLYLSQQEYTKAISDFTRAVELSPREAKIYLGRGVANAEVGNKEAAKKDLLKAVELDSNMKKYAQAISDRYSLDLFSTVL